MAITLPTTSSVIGSAKKAVESLKKSVTNQIKDLTSVYSKHEDPTKGLPADLFFPDYLNDPAGKYPCIRFSTTSDPEEGKKLFCIYLPCPNGITFTDGGTYSDINLGVVGNFQAEAGRAVAAGDVGGVFNAIGKAGSQVMGLSLKEALTIASGEIAENVKEEIFFSAKKIMAPNANAKFDGNEPRTFSFTFKAVVQTEQEAKSVWNIQRVFRRYTYAAADKGSNNIILSYPPIWKIEFLIDGGVNNRIPKIYGSYLTNLTTTFNSTGPTWTVDGSPLETEITVTFKESRTLNRLDIDMLEKGMLTRGLV